MVKLDTFTITSDAEVQLVNITQRIMDYVEQSGIKEGLVFCMTGHTTSGILVNESLDCLEIDIAEWLERQVPTNYPYAHNHFLPSYGATGGNCPGHLKSMLTGYNCIFPVKDGKMVRGHAQEIYFCEFDGIQEREIFIQVMGE